MEKTFIDAFKGSKILCERFSNNRSHFDNIEDSLKRDQIADDFKEAKMIFLNEEHRKKQERSKYFDEKYGRLEEIAGIHDVCKIK